MALNYIEFSKRIKEKYPVYKDIDDRKLAERIIEKYPDYKSQVTFDVQSSPIQKFAEKLTPQVEANAGLPKTEVSPALTWSPPQSEIPTEPVKEIKESLIPTITGQPQISSILPPPTTLLQKTFTTPEAFYGTTKIPAQKIRDAGEWLKNKSDELLKVSDVNVRNSLATSMFRQLPGEYIGEAFDLFSLYAEPENIIASGLFGAAVRMVSQSPKLAAGLAKIINKLENVKIGNIIKPKTIALPPKDGNDVLINNIMAGLKEYSVEGKPKAGIKSDYGAKIYDNVLKNPLPEFKPVVDEFIPPNLSNNNFFTRTMRNFYNTVDQKIIQHTPFIRKLTVQEGKPIEALEAKSLKLRMQDGLYMRAKEDFIKPLSKLPMEEKKKIGLMIQKYIDVSPEYAPLIEKYDTEIARYGKAIAEIGEEWAKTGAITKDELRLTENIFKENIGKYARTFYLRPPKGEIPFKTPPGRIDRNMFKKKMTDIEWAENALKYDNVPDDVIAQYTAKELEELGKEAKIRYGWVHQGDAMLDKTLKDLVNNYTNMQYLNYIYKNPELFSKEPKPGFTAVKDLITDFGRVGPLKSGYINEGMTDDLKLMTQGKESGFSKFMNGALGLWKISKTAWSPATAMRNYWSGSYIQTDMAGYPVWNPKNTGNYFKSFIDYLAKKGNYKTWRDNGLYGSDYFSVEIDPQLIKTMNIKDVATFGQKFGSILDKVKTSKATSYYGMIDHIARTYLAESALKDGASIAQAVKFANKWQLDYRMVPHIIEQARKGTVSGFITPFISYYYLMTPRVLETTLTRPWVLAKYPIILDGIQELNRQRLDMSQAEVEYKKPTWMKESRWNVLMGGTKQEPRYMDFTALFPFNKDWTTAFVDIGASWDLIQGGGAVRAIQNINQNYDPYFKKNIYNDNDLPFVKANKISAYLFKNLGPGTINSVEQLWKAYNKEKYGYPILRERKMSEAVGKVFGFSTYSGGQNYLEARLKNIGKDIQEINLNIKKNWTDPNTTPEKKKKLNMELTKQLQQKSLEYGKIFTYQNKSIGTKIVNKLYPHSGKSK